MSSDILGDEFDIHGGGLDLIFPHHENEIAQSEAAGKKFARYWMHHGLLTINGQKMSKSLGNFVTIKDFMARYKNPDLLKLFYIFAHYAHPIDYTEAKIGEARAALERILILFNKVTRSQGHKVTSKNFEEIEAVKNKFIAAMDDDFNTPQALAQVFELVNLANKNISDAVFTSCAKATLVELLNILGISLNVERKPEGISDSEIEVKIQERQRARQNKDFALSDKIRKELEGRGVILEDNKDGSSTWRRGV
jgi:cysteinyl-tRNA synthetase